MHSRLRFRGPAFAVAAVVLLLASPVPAVAAPDAPSRSQGVLWGDQRFTDADDLREWLEKRGRSYEVWALRHPHAAAQLDPLDPVVRRDEGRSLPTIGWVAIAAALLPALLALVLAAWPPTLTLARRRIELAAFGVGVIAAGATAIVVAS